MCQVGRGERVPRRAWWSVRYSIQWLCAALYSDALAPEGTPQAGYGGYV